MKIKERIIGRFYSICFIGILLIAWQFVANREIINTFNFSSPIEIIKDLIELFKSGEIWPHIRISFGVSLLGLLYGTIIGIFFAFLFYNFGILSKILDPIMVGFNGLPKLAMGPVFVVWFGIGLKAKIVMSTITVFFPVFFNAYAGFNSTDVNLIDTLRVMGSSKFQIIKKIMLPSCIPWITASLRGGAGAAVTGTIVGEYLGATRGLGWMVQSAGGVYNITRVFSCLVILLVLMAFIDSTLKQGERYLLRWRQ
ncbi:ABC transporter permease [Tissierella creatinini]|nr:ABC transporter permease [Tissierella creatinini]TJX64581.1 ABC transporter permease [Soehngenia saccharolytica]